MPPSHADFLASMDLFSVFTRDEIDRLSAGAQSRFLAFGDTVCKAGEPADGVFVVKSGSIRVFTEESGKEISMGVRKVGEVFAEIVMLRDYRHESSARASAKTELLFIPRHVRRARRCRQSRGARVRREVASRSVRRAA